MPRELVIDIFAGGGGASEGITEALGIPVDIAVNHDPDAIEMHQVNHPRTRHYREDLGKLDPRKVIQGRPVGLLWCSPDCTYHSSARGGKPMRNRAKQVRALPWAVTRWARVGKPRVLILENVREFEKWAPLVPMWTCACGWKGSEGQATLVRRRRRCPRCNSARLVRTEESIPCPDRKGHSFRRWVGSLKRLGYQVEWKSLNSAQYGARTARQRLFLIARRDGKPIVWPTVTHAPKGKAAGLNLQPYRPVADCIDWELPCPSIFNRKRPLAPKTLRRIALGMDRYVLKAADPFLVVLNHGSTYFRGQGIDEPLSTVTGSRGEGLVSPILVGAGGSVYAGKPSPCDQPGNVVMPQDRRAVAAAYLARLGQTGGNGAYVNSVRDPVTTIVSKQEHTMAVALLKQYGCSVAGAATDPLNTTTTVNHHGLLAANVVRFRGDSRSVGMDEPLPTITSGAGAVKPAGAAHALGVAAAYLTRFNHGDKQWLSVEEPLGVVTTQGNKFGLVYAFLTKYQGTAIGQDLDLPLFTQTGKHRYGLVLVEALPGQYEPAVAVDTIYGPMLIADIGLRMLVPRELAAAQGFPRTYALTGAASVQVARIGNSVVPLMAKLLVEANFRPRTVHRRRATCGI